MKRWKICVPTDLSDRSLSVLPVAGRLGSVFLVHAIPTGDPIDGTDVEFRRLRAAHDDLVDLVSEEEDVYVKVVAGRPDRRISTWNVDHGIDAVVVSSHGRTGLARLVWGSVAEGFVRDGRLPTLVVKSADAGAGLEHSPDVMLAVDAQDPESPRLVRHAVEWVKRLGGTLTLVYTMPGYAPPHPSLEERLNSLVAGVPGDMRSGIEIVRGGVQTALAKVAPKHDLLVIGNHSRGGWQRLMQGSETMGLLRSAPAVLVLPISANDT